MRKKLFIILINLIFVMQLSACGGQDPKVIQFQKDLDTFCTDISTIDTAMNQIDASSSLAANELLKNLNELDLLFKDFADLDFPKDFDYLESMADEAASYMTEAVSYYQKIYEDEDMYNEIYEDYASENYSRAWKRVQIITALLRGEEPEEVSFQ